MPVHSPASLDRVSPPGSDGSQVPLTSREREVYLLVMAGKSNKEIGAALGITIRAAKFNVANLFEKRGATSRLDLLIREARTLPCPICRRTCGA